jgi:uncharacterized protein (DUF433 family)
MQQLEKKNRLKNLGWTKKNIPSQVDYLSSKPSSQSLQPWFNLSYPKSIAYARDEWIAVRLHFAAMILRDSVEIDPAIRGGVPVLKGTRIPVSQILAEIAEDFSISEIADDFNLDFDILVNLFEGMSIHLDRPFHR